MHSLKVPMMMNGFLSIHPDPQPAKITPALTTEQTTANLQMTKNTQAHTLDTRRRLHRVPKLASNVVKGSHSPCSLAHVSRAVSTRSSVQIPTDGVQAGT